MFSIKIGKHTKQEESMEFRKWLSRGDVPVKSNGKSQKRSFVADLEEHQTIWNRKAEGSGGRRGVLQRERWKLCISLRGNPSGEAPVCCGKS